MKQIVDSIYSNLQQHMLEKECLKKNSSCHSLNDTVYEINYYIFHMFGDPTKQYISLYEIDIAKYPFSCYNKKKDVNYTSWLGTKFGIRNLCT